MLLLSNVHRENHMPARLFAALMVFAFFCCCPESARAGSKSEQQITWEGLSAVIGQTVRIAMPDGPVIQGRAIALEADALVVDIQNTSDASAYPNGRFLVSRAILHAVDVIQRSSIVGRIIGLGIGGGLGYLATRAAINLTKTSAGAAAGSAPLAAAFPLAGYFLGRSVDRRMTTYFITQ